MIYYLGCRILHPETLLKVSILFSQKALEKDESERAAAHFATGRKHLGENGWMVDKAIMLELCSEGAKARYKTGDIDVMNELISDIVGRDDLSLKEKFMAYEYKMLAEQAEGNYNESISLGLDVRRQLGLPVPENKKVSSLEILVGYLKTNHALGKRGAEELICLPKMTDEVASMGLRISELMLTSCYQVRRHWRNLFYRRRYLTHIFIGISSPGPANYVRHACFYDGEGDTEEWHKCVFN